LATQAVAQLVQEIENTSGAEVVAASAGAKLDEELVTDAAAARRLASYSGNLRCIASPSRAERALDHLAFVGPGNDTTRPFEIDREITEFKFAVWSGRMQCATAWD
jgi:hypothetical protein